MKKASSRLFIKKTKNSRVFHGDIAKKVIEKEPVSILDNQHIIREIEKKEEKDDYCFTIRLDPRVKRTSIIYTKLIDLQCGLVVDVVLFDSFTGSSDWPW